MTDNPPVLATIDTFRNQIIECDALTLCKSLPPASVDMILTDVPYGSTALPWDVVVPFEPMWAAFKRVIKPRGAVVMTAAGMFAHKLAVSNEEWYRYEWVIEKALATNFLDVSWRPLGAHEMALVFYEEMPNYTPQMSEGVMYSRVDVSKKGLGVLRGQVKPAMRLNRTARFPRTVIKVNNGDQSSKTHPTEKPVALFEYLIKTYTRPGAIVLDPFCGSGTAAVAAKITGRDFICGDTMPEYVELARRRVKPEFGKAPKRERQPEPLTDLPLFAKVTV